MLKDKKILLVGAVQSLFEGAMYIFVLQAPILESQFFIFILLFALQAPILKLQCPRYGAGRAKCPSNIVSAIVVYGPGYGAGSYFFFVCSN